MRRLFAQLLGLRGLGLLVSALALMLLAQALGPGLYGGLVTGLAAVQLCSAITDLGVSRAVVVRHPGRTSPTRLVACEELLGFALVIGPVLAGASVFLLNTFVYDDLPPGFRLQNAVILGGGLSLIADYCATAYTADQLGRGRLQPAAWGEAAARLVNLGAAAAIHQGAIALETGAFLYGAAGCARLVAIVLLNQGQLRPRRPGAHLRGVYVAALPLASAAIVGQLLLRLDQLVVEAVAGASEAGYYAGAYRLLFLVLTPVMVLNQLHFSNESAFRAPSLRAALRRAMPASIVVILVASVALAMALSPFIVELLLGSAFGASVDVFRVLVLSAVPTTFNLIAGAVLSARGRNSLLFWATLLGLTVNAAALSVLVPTFGAKGAAAALVTSESSSSLMLVLVLASGGRDRSGKRVS